MTTADFYVFKVANLTPDEADLVAATAFEEGASGTEEVLPFEQKGREYEPVTLVPSVTELKVYFETTPPLDFVEKVKNQAPAASVHIAQEANRDWMQEWKKGFTAFALAGDTWVVPSWLETPPAAKIALRIDPGMAFGTGTHETTRLAAGFLQDYGTRAVKHWREACESAVQEHEVCDTGLTLLDVGTGTGILALQGELLGFRNAFGNDIDPEARRVARENIALNNSNVQILDEDVHNIGGQYDWVIANIIDGVLVKLQTDLRARVKPGGSLLLTGILNERDELFRSEFSFVGFQLVERRTLGEWVGYLLTRRE